MENTAKTMEDRMEEMMTEYAAKGLTPTAIRIAAENKVNLDHVDIGYFNLINAGRRKQREILSDLWASYCE